MKFFVYTLYISAGGHRVHVADVNKVNALPAREALQALYIINGEIMLKLPSMTTSDAFKVRDYGWADTPEQAQALTMLSQSDFAEWTGTADRLSRLVGAYQRILEQRKDAKLPPPA